MTYMTWHGFRVITSWKTSATRRFAEEGRRRFPVLDREKANARLQVLDAIQSIDEIPHLESTGMHGLSGDRADQWAMIINGPWRLVFRFDGVDASEVEIVSVRGGKP